MTQTKSNSFPVGKKTPMHSVPIMEVPSEEAPSADKDCGSEMVIEANHSRKMTQKYKIIKQLDKGSFGEGTSQILHFC